VDMEVGRLRHAPRLQFRAVGYVVEGVAYVAGGLLIAGGLYLVMRGAFPAWWQQRLLWPLVRVTPTVAHMQGVAAVGLGASIVIIVLTSVVPAAVGGILVLVAFVAYLVALALFLFSTWLSRRPA
jgi:hypothetical protein